MSSMFKVPLPPRKSTAEEPDAVANVLYIYRHYDHQNDWSVILWLICFRGQKRTQTKKETKKQFPLLNV
jgi:hypothetical protein